MTDVRRLPGPNADFWDWQLNSACRGLDSEYFYHPEGERGQARENRIARAKSICGTCSVAKQCLDYSIETREPYGVWGGVSEDERAAIIARINEKAKRNIS